MVLAWGSSKVLSLGLLGFGNDLNASFRCQSRSTRRPSNNSSRFYSEASDVGGCVPTVSCEGLALGSVARA